MRARYAPLGGRGRRQVRQLDFTGAGNISVEGVHVDNSAKGGATTPLVRIVGSTNISLANSEVNGSDDNDFADWQGVYVRQGPTSSGSRTTRSTTSFAG